MSIFDAIQKANAFVLTTKGVQGEPDSVRLVRDPAKNHFWRMLYHFSLFYPDIALEGGVVDGGEFIVDVNDKTGEVTIFYS
jgi:hypothetical protein